MNVSFQLKNWASRECTVILPDGTEGKIGIEYIPTIEPYNAWDSYYKNASGTWRVYYKSVIFQEFYIKIGNHKITNAGGSNYSVPLGTASDSFYALDAADFDAQYECQEGTHRRLRPG